MDQSDRELVTRVVATGDEAAFRALYQRHTPTLYRTAVRLTDDRDGTAEDFVHDTWIRASERWAEFEWRSSLRTWLTGILLNRVREARRRWARQPTDELVTDISTDCPEPDDRLDLEAAVAKLPAGYRSAIVLHDVEGFSHEEIASLCSIDVGTSKSQLSRARRALRRWLEPRWSTT
ncbi:MAG: RNA polymerase sigma factor [Gemmatimonadetes bacterium]|nr:RNA polymerase sigma factor [Gemmatimonadota bacterium]